jgi:hypothetical protein
MLDVVAHHSGEGCPNVARHTASAVLIGSTDRESFSTLCHPLLRSAVGNELYAAYGAWSGEGRKIHVCRRRSFGVN